MSHGTGHGHGHHHLSFASRQVSFVNRSQVPLQIDWVTYVRDRESRSNLVEFLVYARKGFEPAARVKKKIITDVYQSGSKLIEDLDKDDG